MVHPEPHAGLARLLAVCPLIGQWPYQIGASRKPWRAVAEDFASELWRPQSDERSPDPAGRTIRPRLRLHVGLKLTWAARGAMVGGMCRSVEESR